MAEDVLALVSVEIDWSVFDKHGYPPNMVTCACGGVWRTHTKLNMEHKRSVPRRPCPKCGRFDWVTRASSDPEKFIVGGT